MNQLQKDNQSELFQMLKNEATSNCKNCNKAYHVCSDCNTDHFQWNYCSKKCYDSDDVTHYCRECGLWISDDIESKLCKERR